MTATTQIQQDTAYASAGFTAANFNSLAAGSFVLASSAITPTSNDVDPYWLVSFSLTVGGTTVAGDYATLYVEPLNQDGSTYGDGTASGATLPQANYAVATCGIKAGVTSGNVVTGTFGPFQVPWQNFKFALAWNSAVALSSSAAAAVQYSTARDNLNV